jgi:hypothetical protein
LATAPYEFVCADCKADVFSFGGSDTATRCANCEIVRELKARDGMSPEAETELRKLLSCEIPACPTCLGKRTYRNNLLGENRPCPDCCAEGEKA